MLVDQRAHSSVRAHVEAFRSEHGIVGSDRRVDGYAIAWRKSPTTGTWPMTVPSATVARAAASRRSRPRRRADAIDLTVVVVFYNMRREAARTLQSLSRSYQESVDDIDYEVIVVENGSDDEREARRRVRAELRSRVRYLDLGDDAAPSPVTALNRGSSRAAGARSRS